MRTAVKRTKKCSLWLMPPPLVRMELKEQITKLSKAGGEGASVPFEPHITIIGGIQLDVVSVPKDDNGDVGVAGETLCQEMKKLFGTKFRHGIECQFQKVVSVQRDDGSIQWNQALVVVLEQTPTLMNLVDSCLTYFERPLHPKFAPKLEQPHLSLYYGTENVPDPEIVEIPTSFISTEIALWSTDPASVEGVALWEQVGIIKLDE